MPETPISVVIPTLDESAELPDTLDAVYAAFGEAADVIVVDGGSTDATREIAAARARLIESAPGRGRQLNVGARHARGDALVFLHADTWPGPGAGRAVRAALNRPGVVGGCFRLALRGPTAGRPIARVLAGAINARTRIFRTATGDQSIFARRSAFERAGGFPEHELFEDVVFYARLRRLGGLALCAPAVRTSDRRWRERGYLRTIAVHLLMWVLFRMGVAPDRLARLYRSIA